MATSTPFVTVSVNRFGFKVLETRINLVNTENPKALAVMLALAVAEVREDEYAEYAAFVEEQYSKEVDAQSSCSVPSEYVLKPFKVNDNLVSIRYEVVYDNY